MAAKNLAKAAKYACQKYDGFSKCHLNLFKIFSQLFRKIKKTLKSRITAEIFMPIV